MSMTLRKRWVKKSREIRMCWICSHYILLGVAHWSIVAVVPEMGGFVTLRQCVTCDGV